MSKLIQYKAQFLTSAILHYIHCSQTPDINGASAVGSEEIERIVCSVLARRQADPAPQQEDKLTAPVRCQSVSRRTQIRT